MRTKFWFALVLIGGSSHCVFADQILSTRANLDLQEKCARQAKVQFKNDGWADEKLAAYTNH